MADIRGNCLTSHSNALPLWSPIKILFIMFVNTNNRNATTKFTTPNRLQRQPAMFHSSRTPSHQQPSEAQNLASPARFYINNEYTDSILMLITKTKLHQYYETSLLISE